MSKIIHTNVQPGDMPGIIKLLEKHGPGAQLVHDPRLSGNATILETHEYVPVEEEPLVARTIANVTGEDDKVDKDDKAKLRADGTLRENRAADDGPLMAPAMDFGVTHNTADDEVPLTCPLMF